MDLIVMLLQLAIASFGNAENDGIHYKLKARCLGFNLE
jgi:hypothetical protein